MYYVSAEVDLSVIAHVDFIAFQSCCVYQGEVCDASKQRLQAIRATLKEHYNAL